MKNVVRRCWAVLAAPAVLLPHALLFDFVNDDAYISFRYARNLGRSVQWLRPLLRGVRVPSV